MKQAFPFYIFLLILLYAQPPSPAGEADAPHALDRTLRLDLWGVGLNQAGAAIREQTGIEVLFYRPDFPGDALSQPDVFLTTGNVTLGAVMETLARRFSFRFRVTSAGKIEVSRGYGWVGERQSLRFVRTPPLISRDAGDAAFRELLTEIVKPLPLLGGEFSLRFEPYPLPKNPDNRRGTLVLPEALADYVERGIRCLAGEAGDYPPPKPGMAARNLFARARDYGPDWEGLLSRRIRAPLDADLQALLRDVAMQAGVAILLRAPPESRGTPLPADIERYTLGRICEALARDRRLGRRVFLSCGAVVFDGGEAEEMETDGRSRELFWEGLAVAGFDVGTAVKRTRGPQALTTLLRRDVFPGLWRDPVCAMAYSPANNRLTAVAPINVMQALAERIRELEGK